jgi:hypothetical protein
MTYIACGEPPDTYEEYLRRAALFPDRTRPLLSREAFDRQLTGYKRLVAEGRQVPATEPRQNWVPE